MLLTELERSLKVTVTSNADGQATKYLYKGVVLADGALKS
jgi:hypothetical protein